MSASPAEPAAILPHFQPASREGRLLLFAVRRMAVGGLDDAHAAHALLSGFGMGFRRPLVLLRALMLELSRAAERKLVVAPCCCPRATHDEAALIEALCLAQADPADAHATLAKLLGRHSAMAALTTAQALAAAFADAGRPLG